MGGGNIHSQSDRESNNNNNNNNNVYNEFV